MQKLLAVLMVCPGWAQTASATSYSFDIYARAVNGDPIFGQMTYSTPPYLKFGNDHIYRPGQEKLSLNDGKGFALTLSNIVTGFGTGRDGIDYFYAQSFQSEDPNGWHIAIDFRAKGWLGGVNELPQSFPSVFEYSNFQAYKTDEGNIIASLEATIDWIVPTGTLPPVAAVSLPPSAALLGSVFLIVALMGRRSRRRATA